MQKKHAVKLPTETIVNYVSVLPKNLGIMAPERKGFWIAASELAR